MGHESKLKGIDCFCIVVLKKWGPEHVVRRVFPGKDEIRGERKEIRLWQGSENSLALE